MKPYFLMMSMLAFAFLTHMDANAACGGGGWSKPKVDPVVLETSATSTAPAEVVDLSDNAQVMSVKAGPVLSAKLNSAAFDTLSTSLNLNEGQRSDIAAAKAQIQNRLTTLKNAYDDAQTALMKCEGRCIAEGKNLEAASLALKNFDPNKSFASHLSRILKPSQMAQLEGSHAKTAGL